MVALSKLCNMQNHYTPFTISSVLFKPSWNQPPHFHFGKARPLVSLSSSNSQFSFYKAEYFVLVFSLIVLLKFNCPSHISVSKGLYSYNGSLTSQNNFYPTFGKWLIESSSKRIRKGNIMKVFVLKYRITGTGIVNFGTFWDF